MAWGFHYDDVAPEVVQRDMEGYPLRGGNLPAWGSASVPFTVALWSVTPGGALAEAAAVRTPVLVALGERDVLVDPRGETRAYESSPSVDFFVCPRMAHMHNFAGTRELFWQRIHTWAELGAELEGCRPGERMRQDDDHRGTNDHRGTSVRTV